MADYHIIADGDTRHLVRVISVKLEDLFAYKLEGLSLHQYMHGHVSLITNVHTLVNNTKYFVGLAMHVVNYNVVYLYS